MKSNNTKNNIQNIVNIVNNTFQHINSGIHKDKNLSNDNKQSVHDIMNFWNEIITTCLTNLGDIISVSPELQDEQFCQQLTSEIQTIADQSIALFLPFQSNTTLVQAKALYNITCFKIDNDTTQNLNYIVNIASNLNLLPKKRLSKFHDQFFTPKWLKGIIKIDKNLDEKITKTQFLTIFDKIQNILTYNKLDAIAKVVDFHTQQLKSYYINDAKIEQIHADLYQAVIDNSIIDRHEKYCDILNLDLLKKASLDAILLKLKEIPVKFKKAGSYNQEAGSHNQEDSQKKPTQEKIYKNKKQVIQKSLYIIKQHIKQHIEVLDKISKIQDPLDINSNKLEFATQDPVVCENLPPQSPIIKPLQIIAQELYNIMSADYGGKLTQLNTFGVNATCLLIKSRIENIEHSLLSQNSQMHKPDQIKFFALQHLFDIIIQDLDKSNDDANKITQEVNKIISCKYEIQHEIQLAQNNDDNQDDTQIDTGISFKQNQFVSKNAENIEYEFADIKLDKHINNNKSLANDNLEHSINIIQNYHSVNDDYLA